MVIFKSAQPAHGPACAVSPILSPKNKVYPKPPQQYVSQLRRCKSAEYASDVCSNNPGATRVTGHQGRRSMFPPHRMTPTLLMDGSMAFIWSDMAAATLAPAASSTTSCVWEQCNIVEDFYRSSHLSITLLLLSSSLLSSSSSSWSLLLLLLSSSSS